MTAPVAPKVTLLDNVCTGDCPCGCGEPAYAFTIEGMAADAYYDASPRCAGWMGADALARQNGSESRKEG